MPIVRGMKRRLSPPTFVAATALALFCAAAWPAYSADILWKATGSGAWITAANWTGDTRPWSGDVAVFDNTSPVNIGIALRHPSYSPAGEGWVGAISVLSSRVKELTISGNVNTTSSFYFQSATLYGVADTILASESNSNFTLAADTASYTRQMNLVLRDGQDHVVQVRGGGNVTLKAPIVGTGASLSIRGSGAGAAILSGTGGTYSGGTTLHEGRLFITANGAAGTGALTLKSGTAQVASGVAFGNRVVVEGASAVYQRVVADGGAYAGFTAESRLGGRDVVASLLAGSATGERTLSTTFQTTAVAGNDAARLSDVLSLSSTGDDIFVLQLRLESGALDAPAWLAWQDGGEWVNAIAGNSAVGGSAISGFAGSFALSGAQATGDYLGSWGYDLAAGSVWAVLDHNSDFAIAVPEPGSLLLLGAGALVFLRKRRKV